MGRHLTLKQSRFVMEYLACGCASDAYRAAYEAGQMSHGAIQVEASRLLDHPKIAAAVEEHRAILAKRARHSLQDCIADQERAMELAEAAGNASAYAQAAMLTPPTGLGRRRPPSPRGFVYARRGAHG